MQSHPLAGCVSANTRLHQLHWGDREMGTAIISCVECSQVAGLIQKVGRDSSKSTVSSYSYARVKQEGVVLLHPG